jgi:hypothetical protein
MLQVCASRGGFLVPPALGSPLSSSVALPAGVPLLTAAQVAAATAACVAAAKAVNSTTSACWSAAFCPAGSTGAGCRYAGDFWGTLDPRAKYIDSQYWAPYNVPLQVSNVWLGEFQWGLQVEI